MKFLFGIFFIILGILNILKPGEMVRIRNFSEIRGGEPTEFSIFTTIILGLIFIGFGIYCFFIPN